MKALFALFAAALLGCAAPPQKLVVGSKPFTESELLGEMLALLAESLGAEVERKFYLGDMLCFEALRTGEMDLYAEYTGTGLLNMLKEPAGGDPAQVFSRVRSEFQARWGLIWLPPLGFNNSYALVMRGAHAKALGIERLSQLRVVSVKLRCGFDLVFYDRPDGYRGMLERYGDFCHKTSQMAPGLMYEALAAEQVDLISGYSTDGRIASLGLVALADDLAFFPPYQAAPLAAPAAFRKVPALRAKLEALAGRITDE